MQMKMKIKKCKMRALCALLWDCTGVWFMPTVRWWGSSWPALFLITMLMMVMMMIIWYSQMSMIWNDKDWTDWTTIYGSLSRWDCGENVWRQNKPHDDVWLFSPVWRAMWNNILTNNTHEHSTQTCQPINTLQCHTMSNNAEEHYMYKTMSNNVNFLATQGKVW